MSTVSIVVPTIVPLPIVIIITAVIVTKHIDTEAHAKQKILELREKAKKQQQWFEDHLVSSVEIAKQAEKILKNQIAGMEDRHERRSNSGPKSNCNMRYAYKGTRPKSTHSKRPSTSCASKWTWGRKEYVWELV